MKRYEYGLVMTTNAKVGGSSPSWRANKKISRQRDFFIGKHKEEGTRTRKGASEKRECPEDIREASGPSRPEREAKGGGCEAAAKVPHGAPIKKILL